MSTTNVGQLLATFELNRRGEGFRHFRPDIAAEVAPIKAILASVERKAQATLNDADLSATGRANRLRLLGREALDAIATWRNEKLARLDTHAAQLRSEAEDKRRGAPLNDTFTLVRTLRHSAIWRQLEGLSEDEVALIYKGTANSELRTAIETAPLRITRVTPEAVPMARPAVAPEVVEAVSARTLAVDAPEAAERIKELVALRSMFSSVAGTARQDILQQIPNADQPEPAQPAPAIADGKISILRDGVLHDME